LRLEWPTHPYAPMKARWGLARLSTFRMNIKKRGGSSNRGPSPLGVHDNRALLSNRMCDVVGSLAQSRLTSHYQDNFRGSLRTPCACKHYTLCAGSGLFLSCVSGFACTTTHCNLALWGKPGDLTPGRFGETLQLTLGPGRKQRSHRQPKETKSSV
jgi:hypothetical protein